jgi:uncharacterized surface protein with fasciclin (FAS1) repeats
MKNLKRFSMALFAMFAMASCSSDDDSSSPTPGGGGGGSVDPVLNIVETAQATPSLSILVEAIIQADLVAALSASGDRTVFAPTNDAFTAFLQDKGFAQLTDVPNDVLTQILLNHVIDGTNIMAADLADETGYASTLASGPENTNLSIYWDGTNGVELNGASTVDLADVMASNGIIHVVDAVIDLPTIATFATTNPALSTLVEALAYADTGMPTVLPSYLETVLDPEAGPLTVFAPVNDAFGDLLVDVGADELADVDTATVDAILTYHIVSNTNVTSGELMDGPVTTIGGDITLDATALTLTDPNGGVSNIVGSLVDIQGTNGVVHVIDRVIRP